MVISSLRTAAKPDRSALEELKDRADDLIREIELLTGGRDECAAPRTESGMA